MVQIQFKHNMKDILNSFSEMKKEAIDTAMTGLDPVLIQDLNKLKSQLKSIVAQEPVKPTEVGATTQRQLTEIRPAVDNIKSKEVIVEELTGINTTEYNKNKELTDYYQSPGRPKLVVAQRSKNSSTPARITLKMPILEGDTVNAQYERAKGFFAQAVFGIKGPTGDIQYTLPLENIVDEVKIKCSKYKGADDYEEHGGFSPERRFEQDSLTKGFAEWTLPQEVVRRIVDSGVNVNKLADSIADQDFDQARDYLAAQKVKNPEIIKKLEERVGNFEKNENLSPDSKKVNVLNRLIQNLKIFPVRKKQSVRYEVVTSVDGKVEDNAIMLLERELSLWKNSNANKWVNKLADKIVKTISKFFKVR